MVEVVGHKLKTQQPVMEPVSDIRGGNGIFRCRDGGSRSAFCLAETDAETRTNSKKPAVHGTNARITQGVRYLKTGWWRHSGTNWRPTTQSSNRSPRSAAGTEFFDAETEGQIRLFALQRLTQRRGQCRKSPLSAGQMHGSPAEFDT